MNYLEPAFQRMNRNDAKATEPPRSNEKLIPQSSSSSQQNLLQNNFSDAIKSESHTQNTSNNNIINEADSTKTEKCNNRPGPSNSKLNENNTGASEATAGPSNTNSANSHNNRENENRQRLIIVQQRRQHNDDDNANNVNRYKATFSFIYFQDVGKFIYFLHLFRRISWEVHNIHRISDPILRHLDQRYQSSILQSNNSYISDRGLCSFGMPRRNVQEGIVWIRAELRPADTLLERITVRNYRSVTDVTLRHLAVCAPNLQYLDVTGTSVTRKGIDTFLDSKPQCRVVSNLPN